MWVFFTGLAIFWNDINRKNWSSTKQATSFLVHGAGATDVIYKSMHLAVVGRVLSNFGISSDFHWNSLKASIFMTRVKF